MTFKQTIFIVCNAFDDGTRIDRKIETDSPAASKKVLELAHVIGSHFAEVKVLSLGRGRSKPTLTLHKSKRVDFDKYSIEYCSFLEAPVLSQFGTVLSLLFIVMLRVRHGNRVLFYNRHPAYLLTLMYCGMRNIDCYLDLEDGEVDVSGRPARILSFSRYVYDRVCNRGALLACTALSKFTSISPTLPYYGVVKKSDLWIKDWREAPIRFIYGGTIETGTGSSLFHACMEILEGDPAFDGSAAEFHVSGQGADKQTLRRLSETLARVQLIVHDRLNNEEYINLLHSCHVGLSLKLPSGPYANTTFPSKVVEYSAYGMLSISTDISDVRMVLGGHGLFLSSEDPAVLAMAVRNVLENREDFSAVAAQSRAHVERDLAPEQQAKRLEHFFS